MRKLIHTALTQGCQIGFFQCDWHQKFCLAFRLFLAFFGCRVQTSMILGEKLRDHRQILNEELVFFFKDYHDFGTKIENSFTD